MIEQSSKNAKNQPGWSFLGRNAPAYLIWLIPVFVYLTAVLLRYGNHLSSPLIPGVNGGYYPLLVRNLLLERSLGYPDLPLVFFTEAILARLLGWLSGAGTETAIMASVRCFDILIPPLIALPVFTFSLKNLSVNKHLAAIVLITALSALYFSLSVILSPDMHKNAAGMVLVAWWFVLFYKLLKVPRTQSVIWLAICTLLLVLTHFGSLMLIMAFAAVFFGTSLVQGISTGRRKPIQIALLVIVAMVVSGLLLYVADLTRGNRLLQFIGQPLRLFNRPWIGMLFSGQNPYPGWITLQMIILQLGSAAALWQWYRQKGAMPRPAARMLMNTSLLTLFLSSPLIGADYVLRIQAMLWIPALVMLTLLYPYLKEGLRRGMILALLTMILGFSVIATTLNHRVAEINIPILHEMYELKEKAGIGENDLVLARHGLEWWAAWALHAKIGHESSLSASDTINYNRIFILRIKDGHAPNIHHNNDQFARYPLDSDQIADFETDALLLYRIKPDDGPLDEGE